MKHTQCLTVFLLCVYLTQIVTPTQCLVASCPQSPQSAATIPTVGEFYMDRPNDYFFFYRMPAFETAVNVYMFHSLFESDVELIGNPEFFPNQIFNPALIWNDSLSIINYSYVDSPSELVEKCVDYWEIAANGETVLRVARKSFSGWLYYKALIVDSNNVILAQSEIQDILFEYFDVAYGTTLGNQFDVHLSKKQIDMGDPLNVSFEFSLAPFERIYKVVLRDGSNVLTQVFLNEGDQFATGNLSVCFPLAHDESAFSEAEIYVYTYKIDVSGNANSPAITIYQSKEFSFKIYNDRPYLIILGVGLIATFVGIVVWVRRSSTKNYTEALRKILNSTNAIRKEDVP